MFDMKIFFSKVEIDLNNYFYNELHLPLELKLNIEFYNKNLNILRVNIKLIKDYHFFIEKLNMDNLIEELLNRFRVYLLNVDIESLVIDSYSNDEVVFSLNYKVGSDSLYSLLSVEKFYLDLNLFDLSEVKILEIDIGDLSNIFNNKQLDLLIECNCFYIYDEECLTLIRYSNSSSDFNNDIFFKELSKGVFYSDINCVYELSDKLKDSIIVIKLSDFLK